MNWSIASHLVLLATRHSDERSLTVTVMGSPGTWAVIVVESGVQRGVDERPEHTIERVFDDHAHQVLESQPTLTLAMAQAEKYVKWWQRSNATHAECPCEPIAKEK